MRSGLLASSPLTPSGCLTLSCVCSPPAENISLWSWGDYRWFVTGEGAGLRASSQLTFVSY